MVIRGYGELLLLLQWNEYVMSDSEEERRERQLKVVVVGESSVGKVGPFQTVLN